MRLTLSAAALACLTLDLSSASATNYAITDGEKAACYTDAVRLCLIPTPTRTR